MEKSVHTQEYAVFRRLLRETREAGRITQVELARRLDQTQSFVSKIERGETRLDLIQLRTICALIGTDLRTFVDTFEQRLTRIRNPRRARRSEQR